jgi:hypothetical protein
MRVGLLLQFQDHVGEAGVEAHEIALLDRDLVRLKDTHERLVAHRAAFAAEVRVQIHQHAPALCAVLGEVLDAERLCARAFVFRP